VQELKYISGKMRIVDKGKGNLNIANKAGDGLDDLFSA